MRRQVHPIETEWTIQQLVAAGYIDEESTGLFCLTDAGRELCNSIEFKLTVAEVILLLMFYGEIANSIREEE